MTTAKEDAGKCGTSASCADISDSRPSYSATALSSTPPLPFLIVGTGAPASIITEENRAGQLGTCASSADATGSQVFLSAAIVSSASALSFMTVQTDESASMTTMEEHAAEETQQACMCPGHVGRGGTRRHLDPGRPESVNDAFGRAFDDAREWERSSGQKGAQMKITQWRKLCTELRHRIPECAIEGSLKDRRHRESGWSPVVNVREDREQPESFLSWMQGQATARKAQMRASRFYRM